ALRRIAEADFLDFSFAPARSAAAIAREALSQGGAFSPHPDQTSPMTVGPEDYFEEPLVDRLRKRAKAAREEKNATALSDALHFEQAASDLERLQQDLVFWKANSVSESKARIAAETALAHPAVLVLVPREPTEAMLQAACDATFGPAMRTHEENHRLGW